uniref:Uncharacterized protein n=1 Tax=Noccaea caerulescens TaxID=107243 RepID=A0A1J3II29_NOCCA
MKEEEEKPKRRKCLSIYDRKLWEGFEEEGIDRILRGEITPKNLIITFPLPPFRKQMILKQDHGYHYLQREHLFVKELLSVFPNSKTIEWETYKTLQEILPIAKRMGITSIIIGRCTLTHDEMRIISMMNGAYSCFRVFDLISEDLGPQPPNHGNPTTNVVHPQLCMERFKSPASVGTARMI